MMSSLKQVLEHCNTRLVYEDRWLTFNVGTNEYEVWTREHRQTKLLIATIVESAAINVLMNK